MTEELAACANIAGTIVAFVIGWLLGVLWAVNNKQTAEKIRAYTANEEPSQ